MQADVRSGAAGWRLMTWLIVAWNVVMVAWFLWVANAMVDNCRYEAQLYAPCEVEPTPGTDIGLVGVVQLAVAGNGVAGAVWVLARSRDRRATGIEPHIS